MRGDRHQADGRHGRDAQPAHDHRQRERDLDAPELLATREAHRLRRLAHRRRHAVDPGHDAAEQDLQRVAHERDLGGELGQADDRRQQDEQRQARDRVQDPGRPR